MRFEGSRCPYLAYNVPRIRVADEDLVIDQDTYDSKIQRFCCGIKEKSGTVYYATGVKRIKDVCVKAGCRVEFETPDDGFVVVFYRHGTQKLSGTAQKEEKTAQKSLKRKKGSMRCLNIQKN